MDTRPFDMCYIDPGYFVAAIPLRAVKPAKDGKFYNIIVYDGDLKVKKRIASPIEALENPDSPYLTTGGMNCFENQLRYKQPFVNDIYTLDKNLDYRVFCKMEFDKYKVPESKYSSIGSSRSDDNYKGNFGITNDFDGSMAFWPDLSTGPDELIRSFNAIDFMELCDQNHAKKFKSKFPAQQKKLLDVLGKLREDSNPVIQVVTLKNS